MNAIQRQILAGYAIRCLINDGYQAEAKIIRRYLDILRTSIQGQSAQVLSNRTEVMQVLRQFGDVYPNAFRALESYIYRLEDDWAFARLGYVMPKFDTQPI